MDGGDALDLIAEELDADRGFIEVGGMDFDHIAAHPVFPAAEGDVVPFEKQPHQSG